MGSDKEIWTQFENRKADHIRVALDPRSQVESGPGLDRVELIHEALPEIDLKDVDVSVELWGHRLNSPLFVSSMTSGHSNGETLNQYLAEACHEMGWALGCGSQRRELTDPQSHREWLEIRQQFPKLFLLGNLGLSQLIVTSIPKLQKLVERLNLNGLFIHTNPLQECLQPEGTAQFRGGLKALEKVCRALTVPVVLKETGCGFSMDTLRRLKGIGLTAVDVSGLGGTHWGRVEGYRSQPNDMHYAAAQSFANWGIPTVESLQNAVHTHPDYQIWASGGVRSGMDAAKLLAMGAHMVGLAQPILKTAIDGPEALKNKMKLLNFELQIALFCTGATTVGLLRENKRWRLK